MFNNTPKSYIPITNPGFVSGIQSSEKPLVDPAIKVGGRGEQIIPSRRPVYGSTSRGPKAQNVQATRRISRVHLKQENFWQQILAEMNTQDILTQSDIDRFVTRALSFDIDSTIEGSPKATELIAKVSAEMYKQIVALAGRGVNIPGSGLEKVKNMERVLTALEMKKQKELEMSYQSKIGDLTQLIQTKEKERDLNRRSIMIEMKDMKEKMNNQSLDQLRNTTQKMIMMEQELIKIDERIDPKTAEIAALSRKLEIFQAKFGEMEEEKKLREQANKTDDLQKKIEKMEKRLETVTRRKTMVLQSEQIAKLQNEINNMSQSNDQVSLLEKKMLEIQATPVVINDAETRQIQSYIKRLEEKMKESERQLEEQAKKAEFERRTAQKRRIEQEEINHRNMQKRDELFTAQLKLLEEKIKKADDQRKMEVEQRVLSLGGDQQTLLAMKALEERLVEAEATLAAKRSETERLFEMINSKTGDDLSSTQKDFTLMMLKAQNEELLRRVNEQESLMRKQFDSITDRIDKAAAFGPVNVVKVKSSGMSYEEIQNKMNEIQKKLFDENIEDKESELLNIAYEKLVTELESTDEYKNEQAAALQQWSNDNKPLNVEALQKLRDELNAQSPMKKAATLKRKPELKLLELTHDQILKKHPADFKSLTAQNLSLDEARALYECLPVFRKDQEVHLQFSQQLKEKIESEMKKPKKKLPPPITASINTPKFKPQSKKSDSGSDNDFLAELLRKRKAVGS